MSYHLKWDDLAVIAIAFSLAAVVGTLTHELGHIAVAKSLGYETQLHYGSMSWNRQSIIDTIHTLNLRYQTELENNLPFPERERYFHLSQTLSMDSLLIRLGGPLETILTGCLGLFFLIARRTRIQKNGLTWFDWLAIVLALFWSRELFNVTVSVGSGLLRIRQSFFGGDEAFISQLLGLPIWFLPTLLGLIGMAVCAYVVFRIVPQQQRFPLMLAGVAGSVSGFVFWFYLLGPELLP